MTLPSAILAAWAAANALLEGEVPHFYLDTKGLVTIGIGNLADARLGAFDRPQGPTDIAALKSLAAFDWSNDV